MKEQHREIIERVEKVRVHLGLNKSRFSAAFGMKAQTYNNFIGAQGSKPNVEMIIGLCDAHGVRADWLLWGEGPMFREGMEPQAPPGLLERVEALEERMARVESDLSAPEVEPLLLKTAAEA